MFHLRAVILVLVIMLSWSSTAMSQTFSQSDLAGSWWGAGIASGDDAAGETPLSMYFDLTVDNTGSTTGNATAFFESGTTNVTIGPITLGLNSAGIITDSSDPTGHGILSGTTNLLAFTNTDDGYHLKIAIKPVRNNFATSELQGDWRGCQVVSGDVALGDDPRNGYGEVSINTQGGITGTWTSYSSGVSNVDPVSGVTFTLSPNGTLLDSGVTSMRGIVNEDVDIMTFSQAEVDDGYSLFFLMRDSGVTTFDVADLQGTWTAHSVITGDRPDITPAWSYATITFDGSGNFAVRSTDPSGNDTDSGTVNLSNRGLITITGENIFGYLSDDGNIFIIISDLGGDGSEFIIGIRGGSSTGGGGTGTGDGGGGGGCFIKSLLK